MGHPDQEVILIHTRGRGYILMYIIHHTQNIEKYIERINSSVGPPRPRGHTGIYMRRRIYIHDIYRVVGG